MREGDTVNVFDRAVAAVAPVHAAKRAAARAALKIIDSGYGNYGANLTKKSLRGWEFYGGSAKEDIEDNIDILRQRSRDAYMGIPTASAALKTMRTNVIAGGLMPAPQIDAEFLGLTPEDAEKLQAQIVREFALWADTPVCDADRVDNFYKLQQLTFLSYAMNGDAIVLLPTKEQTGQPYSLRVRLVEADRVCSPDGFDRLVPCTVQGYDVHCIVQGVETDADGMVIHRLRVERPGPYQPEPRAGGGRRCEACGRRIQHGAGGNRHHDRRRLQPQYPPARDRTLTPAYTRRTPSCISGWRTTGRSRRLASSWCLTRKPRASVLLLSTFAKRKAACTA